MSDISSELKESEQIVVFAIANEHYGVDISAVSTIIRMQNITVIPRTPKFVKGVINLRGSIIPVIDIRECFKIAAGEESKASRIVVVEVGGSMIGLIVDMVEETIVVPAGDIEPPNTAMAVSNADYIRGVARIDSRIVILLELSRVIDMSEVEDHRHAKTGVGANKGVSSAPALSGAW